jgi:hypothetical protein
MGFPNLDHGGEDIIPGILFPHDSIWEHTAIPTNMFKGFCKLTVGIP